jgi:hypothetical protein
MAVTLLQARTEVRSLLDEPTSQFWSDAEINSWIYQGTLDIARQAQNLWMQANITAVALQQNYPCPTDFLGVHRLDFVLSNSDQTYNLEFQGIKNMDDIWGILHSLPAAYPNAFYLWNSTGAAGGQMYFATYPVPGAAGTFTMYYYREAIKPASDSANLDLTPGYEDICYEYAVYKAKRKDRDPTWQDSLGLYNLQLQNLINKTSRFTDQGDRFTSGQLNVPLYAYSDDQYSGF